METKVIKETNMKRLLSCFLALVMVMVLLPAISTMTYADDAASGTIGGCDWEISTEGTDTILTIEPSENPAEGYTTGQLPNTPYTDEARPQPNWPWCKNANITKAIIENGVSASEDLTGLFYYCSALEEVDLSGLDTSEVTNMYEMFSQCRALKELDLSKFDTSKVTDMKYMFNYCSALTKIDGLSAFNTSSVTTMQNMFCLCQELTGLDLSNFDTSNVTAMQNMFAMCNTLTKLNLSGFDTSNVTTMQNMFNGCSALKELDLSNFNTSNVTTMQNMFIKCTALMQLDLSNFNTSAVTNMKSMFNGCTKLETIYVGSEWSTGSVTDSADMFASCSNLVGGAGTAWAEINPTDCTYARLDGGSDTPGYLAEYTTDYLKIMKYDDDQEKVTDEEFGTRTYDFGVYDGKEHETDTFTIVKDGEPQAAEFWYSYDGGESWKYYSSEYENTYWPISNAYEGTITVKAEADGYKTAYAYFDIKLAPADITTADRFSFGEIADQKYTGSKITPDVTIYDTVTGKELVKDIDYAVEYSNNKNAGQATVTVTGIGNYTGTKAETFTIAKASQKIKVSVSTVTVKAANLAKAAKTFKPISVKNAKGTVTYKLYKASKGAKKYLKFDAATGKVTVKKGTPKGTYRIWVKVYASATKNYKAKTGKAIVKIVVK